MTTCLLEHPARRGLQEIIDDATRRRFLQLIGAVGLLAGCASAGDDPSAGSSPTSSSGIPLTIDHEFGQTVIPRSRSGS
ncbi:MAG: twin-arginine translocation signal domain-containing protein [Pseudonocardiales bacterium]